MKRRVFRRRIPKDFKVILDLKLIRIYLLLKDILTVYRFFTFIYIIYHIDIYDYKFIYIIVIQIII